MKKRKPRVFMGEIRGSKSTLSPLRVKGVHLQKTPSYPGRRKIPNRGKSQPGGGRIRNEKPKKRGNGNKKKKKSTVNSQGSNSGVQADLVKKSRRRKKKIIKKRPKKKALARILKPNSQPELEILPDEIFHEIFSFLPSGHLMLNIRVVCWRFFRICNSQYFFEHCLCRRVKAYGENSTSIKDWKIEYSRLVAEAVKFTPYIRIEKWIPKRLYRGSGTRADGNMEVDWNLVLTYGGVLYGGNCRPDISGVPISRKIFKSIRKKFGKCRPLEALYSEFVPNSKKEEEEKKLRKKMYSAPHVVVNGRVAGSSTMVIVERLEKIWDNS